MAKAKSAGVVLYRWHGDVPQVLLVHPGGPFWARKDDGAWSIPKGEFASEEAPEAAARREFEEELGVTLSATLVALTPVEQSRGKTVHPFAAQGDLDVACVRSNSVSIEWPPRSGKTMTFAEIDRACWFGIEEARRKILTGQRGILDQLEKQLANAR